MKDLHSDTIISVQKSLIHVLDEQMKSELQSAKYYGIITGTDLSLHKKPIKMYVCKSAGDLRHNSDSTALTITIEIHNKVESPGLNALVQW